MTINVVTKTVDSPTSLAQSLRHRARFVDVLEHKSGTNTTIAKGRFFVVSLTLHFKASSFGDGNGRLFDGQNSPNPLDCISKKGTCLCGTFPFIIAYPFVELIHDFPTSDVVALLAVEVDAYLYNRLARNEETLAVVLQVDLVKGNFRTLIYFYLYDIDFVFGI